MLSIIIPTREEEKAIGATISRLKSGLTLPHEIIVSDGHSSDRTVEIAKSFGAKVIVKKTPSETKKVIEEQILKFEEAKIQLGGQLHLYKEEFKKMLKEIERMKKENNY